jgi:hypothetical protein
MPALRQQNQERVGIAGAAADPTADRRARGRLQPLGMNPDRYLWQALAGAVLVGLWLAWEWLAR